MIENIADKVERLQRLAKKTGRLVSLDFEVWVRTSGVSSMEWAVWDGHTHFRGVTVEEALRSAEVTHKIIKAEIPGMLILPTVEVRHGD